MRCVGIFIIALFLTATIFGQKSETDLAFKEPSTSGFTTLALNTLTKKLTDSIPSLGSFIIWRNGGIVYEHYFHHADSTTEFDIKSVTKSVLSALAGIARAQGLLQNLDTPVVKYFPEFERPNLSSTLWFTEEQKRQDSIRHTLTLHDLLTMQHGWDWSDFGPVINVFINAVDPVRFTMDLPFADTPGTKFNYSSAAASLFGAVLEKSVQTSLKDFAEKNLLHPANMHLTRWDTDPEGRTVGCSEMYLTPRDMLRFGLLYLHHGKVGDVQVIDSNWIKESTAQHAVLNYWDVLPNADGYGYFWWRRKTNGHQAYIASGAGGQIITVITDLNMVIVGTCLLDDNNRGRSEIKRLHNFIDLVTKNLK